MKQINNALRMTKYLITETDALKLGTGNAEVCFVGRSNAGKSTIINVLCEKKKMTHVSQVPGKTRTINVYEVKPYRWIVDLPGYGYAAGPISQKASFGPMIERYLDSRENLCMVFVILEAVAGPTKLDIYMINWLIQMGYPFSLIVNKIDKISSLKLDGRKQEIAGRLGIDTADIFWVSSKKKTGIEVLRTMIAEMLDVSSYSSKASKQ